MLFAGTSNDSWTGGSIVSQLNPDILTKIQACFQVRELVRLSFDYVPGRECKTINQPC